MPAMIIPVAFGAAILSGLTWAYMRSKAALTAAGTAAQASVSHLPKHGINEEHGTTPGLVRVQLGDDIWEVSKDYIGPIGINEAAALAASRGMTLPSPALVDAIWRQADLKVPPLPRNNVISEAVFADQKNRIEKQIAGREYTLIGGPFKDVVLVNGHPEIYGWQVDAEHTTMVDGKPTYQGVPLNKMVTPGPGMNIQPQSGKRHDQPGPIGFKDYSQGARLVRKLARVA
jgi:hypothetical protein